MQNSKLITILKALNKEEFKQFTRYIDSPFNTQSPELLQLFDYLKPFYPDFDSPKLEKELAFKKLYPKEKFNGPRLRNLLSKINKILEEYLIYLEFQQDDYKRKTLLTQIYGKRNLNVIFKKKTEELISFLEAQPYRDTTYYYDNYLLCRDFYYQSINRQERIFVEYLKSSLAHLNNFYAIERVRLGICLVNRERIYNEPHDFKVNDFVNINPIENILYYLLLQVYELLTTNTEASFFKAKKIFIENIVSFTQTDAQMVLQLLLNYAIQQFPKEEHIFLLEAFELYKFGLDKSIFNKKDYFSNSTYINIAVIGSKLKEFDWVSNFIETKQIDLDATTKEDVVALAKCFLAFNQSDYQTVTSSLQNYEFKDLLYKINAKTILIRSYYKLFEEDSTYGKMVISNCIAFEKFIKRQRSLNDNKKESYLNFCFLLKKIVKYKIDELKIKEADFSYVLNNFSSVFAKSWLQEIIDSS